MQFLFHIFVDELNNIIFSTDESIHNRGNFAKIDTKITDIDLEFLINIIDSIRKDKSEKQFSIKKEIVKLQLDEQYRLPKDLENDLKFICNIKEIIYKKGNILIIY